MDYRKLGNFGVKVSPICLGTAFRGFWTGMTDEATCIRVIERAIDLGINFIDCANFYFAGRCEEVLGKALKNMGGKRDDLIITSKVWSRIGEGPNDSGLSRFHIMREIERSLQRLQLDHIDLYLLHNWDGDTGLDETLLAMDDLVRQGKILYPAVSNFSAWQTMKALGVARELGAAPIVATQPMYNLIKRQAEVEILPMAAAENLAVMPYSPLGGGLLTGRRPYTRHARASRPWLWSAAA